MNIKMLRSTVIEKIYCAQKQKKKQKKNWVVITGRKAKNNVLIDILSNLLESRFINKHHKLIFFAVHNSFINWEKLALIADKND